MSDVGEDGSEAVSKAKEAMSAQQWPRTVVLSRPVSFGKETIEQLVFQRGTFGVLKGLGLSPDRVPTFDECMMIASRLCGQSPKVMELLDPDDADEVIAIALGFFNRCLGAGKKR